VTVLTEQESDWISAVAGRLRLIQSDAAAAAPEQRREYLKEELTRALKPVPPAQRRRYLEALVARFPVAGQVLKPAPSPAPAPKPAAETPERLLARLLAVAAGLAPEQRAQFSQRLAEAGLAPAQPNASILEVPDTVRKALGLAGGQQPRLDRLAQLGVAVVDMVQRVNDRAVDAMRDLFPKSTHLERPPDFRLAAAQFLTGEADSLDAQVRLISGMWGTLLVALQGGGRAFAVKYLEKYSPSAIVEVIESEKQFGSLPWQQSKKECCWDKYDDLAREMATVDLIDRRIKECVARFVKDKGLAGQAP
jgi:hypothetical protein